MTSVVTWTRAWLAGTLILIVGLVARSDEAEHLLLGVPDKISNTDTSNKNHFLMKKEFFALSYNNAKGIPNWVSWHLTKKHLGTLGRKPFKPDDTLPDGFDRIVTGDYTGSGFDRGHMCPHSDRAFDANMVKSTFIMTNILPQSAENNQKAWNQLEIYLRGLVEDEGKEIYIVAGGHGEGGKGKFGFRTRIAEGRVSVPAVTWKVALVLDEGDDDISRMEDARLIGVIIPNDRTPTLQWDTHRVPVKEIEDLTGFSFFSKAQAVLKDLKEDVDDETIPEPVPVNRNN
jgi:endonuclease G